MKSNTFYEYNGPFYSKGTFKVRGNHEQIIGISPSRYIHVTLEDCWRLSFIVKEKERIYG